ncbi:uncharacterized protein KY384_007185 [Bacidia gigantensis]|uniref:uncharacterized protein n=1 Tax=Bacidia gigantensis TaxID=2732470 RepID=UPI001D042DCE|nr:uncharacterized protein KY384_007185 [Bacidia gigantensis]KAG8528268.1 hypothetical protein KY384_007185 [Bacidia gigantensis]
MESLRSKIEYLRYQNENAHGRHFIPHEDFVQLMTRENVHDVLEESSIERYSIEETAETIFKRAARIFGILVLTGQPEFILRFIKGGGHQRSCLDDNLPYSLDTLLGIFEDDIMARKFHERQKEFAVPIFDRSALPRDVKAEITMPFLEDCHIGSGGFGNVYKIKISPSHQHYDPSSDWFVRKEFRPECGKEDFERELRNLSMLRLLRHPHMVELLGVYTYRGMHNFVFPLASHGTLAELFQSEQTPQFQLSEDFLVALAGLGSAICAMHEYSSENLRAIGCHHDLKPSNILVDQSKFILADFGLSRLKELSQTSASLSKDARGDYLAPECEDLEADCEKGIVHRSSDIWSFGCMVAEVLTYMNKGPSGVKKFEAARVFVVRGLKLWRFHYGSGKESGPVLRWIEDLKRQCQGHEEQLAILAREMLSIRPDRRPRAPTVRHRLYAIAIKATTKPIDHLYSMVVQSRGSIQVFVEQKKFESWKQVCGLEMTDRGSIPDDPLDFKSHEAFQSVIANLCDLNSTLRLIEADSQVSKSLLPPRLQTLTAHLYEMLSTVLQDRAMCLWKTSVLETSDEGQLEQVSNEVGGEDLGSDIGTLAAIKRMRVLVQKRSYQTGSLFLDCGQLQNQKLSESFSSQYVIPNDAKTTPVLVERKHIDIHDKGDHFRIEILDRLEEIAVLVNSAASRKSLRVLRCLGVYHDEAHSVFGMVYEFPDLSIPNTEPQATTLAAALERKPGSRELPLLGDRFRLAHDLAAALFRFHSIGWLHKSISSKVVVFFHNKQTAWSTDGQNWYLRGFLHSRLDEGFTEGITSDPEMMDFQHPDYLSGLKRGLWRYVSQFDYYSLGIVLLEIGLWSSLKDMIGKWAGKPEELREKLLSSAVPQLGPRAGTSYRDAVITCLTGRFAGIEDEDPTALHLSFKDMVVDELAQCKA